jgi:Raf kinase inhibitor-like YbhB/YbcL family protein
VLYNLPASVSELPEGLPATEILSNKAVQGRNDFGKFGYGGPCPPAGATHRYFFKVYAVDVDLEPKGGATKQALESAMRGHILAQGTLIGKYARSKG